MRINLSSEFSGSSVEANTLAVAKFVPFCLAAALVAYFILGFQEECYRRQLERAVKRTVRDRPTLDLAHAETQFFTLARRFAWYDPGSWFVLSPDRIAKGVLLLAVLFSLWNVVATFITGLIHLTDTIFFGYPFNLYLASCLALLVLVQTRRIYRPRYRALRRTGRRSARLMSRRLRKWVSASASILGICSLGLPWAVPDWGDETKWGYEFLLANRVDSQSFWGPTYQFDPRVFDQIRAQLWLAIAFLIGAGLWAMLRRRPSSRLFRFLRETRKITAWVVIFLLANYLLYMGILQYEAMVPNPWMDTGFPPSGQGWSMINYDPCCGFWIFAGCCATVACTVLGGWEDGLRRRRAMDMGGERAQRKGGHLSAGAEGQTVRQ